ncbi:hypothetical protein SAMN05421788_10174 [Filimonas lacunae]|uniref:LTXXQ motif family protein n=1 Tax=Filimonas lacunae TaxID=477680 RepID=A0A173MLT8_9BACT|nr:hypothetical protein [Filimonas lacunae]BAV08613.1 hypothetical protein FLA_4659 [Filimonas lacunae]SIS58492.1 hypothetical protein SAMN05421788_10174 [Filimonas lacunae]
MKKIIAGLVLAIALMTTVQSQAQDGDRAARFKQMQKQRLKDSLQLSDDKADKVVAIQEEFMPKQREIFMDQSLDKDAKQAKLKELNEEQKKKLKTVLTDDELAKFEAYQERNRGRRGPGGPGGGGRGGNRGGQDGPPPAQQ